MARPSKPLGTGICGGADILNDNDVPIATNED
jgi:hypothetical protein